MPPEHHDRPQCGSGNQPTNDVSIQSLPSHQQPQQPQQITANGAGRLFNLKPALRDCFACVGATNRPYIWKEVLNLLSDYIRLKPNIISSEDRYKIDCKNDPLSLVLGLNSFQYTEVKKLFSEQVTVAVINDNTVPILIEPPNTISTQPSTSSSSGSSRCLKEYTATINWRKCFPTVPAPKPDDIESIYSYQGYETVSCHNTEYEESEYELASDNAQEASNNTVYEESEYELASDDAQDANVPSDDNDTDVEVLNIDFYEYREDSESDWADEDSNSSDEDPDLACFSWACITCGIKNQPFVNYCEHCWKERKDILPDRPRRNKRRKPRIKKRQRKLSEKPIEPSNKENDFFPPPNFDRSVSLDSNNTSYIMSKSKSQDSVTQIEVKNRTLDYTSSQDSGIGSQDFLTEEHFPDSRMSDKEESSKPSCSKDEDEVSIIFDRKEGKSLKRRQRSSSEEKEKTKRIKIDESEKTEVKDWGKLLQTDSFKEWFSSEEGHKFLSSKSEIMLMHTSSAESSKPSGLSLLCSICLHRPKNGSIVHGRISHISTCYQCAKRLLDTGSRCPVCRRKIHMVTKTIVA